MTDPLREAAQAVVDDAVSQPLDRNDYVCIDPAVIVALEDALARDPEGPMLVPHTCPYCSGLHYASVPPATGQNPEVSR